MNQVTSILKNKLAPPAPSIGDLAARWLDAKANEKLANANRLAAEADLVKLIDDGKIEGTSKAEDGGYTVKVARSLTRAVDMEGLHRIILTLPESIRERLLRTTVSVNVSELRYLESNEPEMFKLASQAVTMKPAKPSISVEFAPPTSAIG
jgi:hypothetical protein